MFTGFASENTPAIQVWDFFRAFASTSAIRSVSLADDCAPIQVFRTGALSTPIRVYLPTAPIEGKQITIVNQMFGNSSQSIEVYSSDFNGTGTNIAISSVGQAQSLVLVYSKQAISFGTNSGACASGWLTLNQSSVASSTSFSVISGGDGNRISSRYAAIVGGQSNVASGNSAVVVGGTINTASGDNSVVGGFNNTAGGYSSVALGANLSAAGGYAVVLGRYGSASAYYSSVLGGNSNNANSENSIVLGGYGGTSRNIIGSAVFSASLSPISAVIGTNQTATLLLGRQTTNATATQLACDANAASTINQVILPNNSAYTFQGTCIANVTAGGDTSGWKFEGVIKRGANAASTVLVAAVVPTLIAQNAGASTWVLAITADTTNGGIAVTVTGAAATTIRWVVKIDTTEVTF
jgi:hypothetical protein